VWGVFLVLAGVGLLGAQYVGADVFDVGWPLFVIVAGALLFVGMFTAPPGRGVGYLAIPGCVILTTGLVLGAQTLTEDWESWAYAWALVAPTSVGLGLLIAGAYERSRGVRIAGAIVTGIGATLFVIAEWFAVRVAKIGGPGLGDWFGYVFPAAVVALGVCVVVLGTRRAR
jgi:hypothetical protein